MPRNRDYTVPRKTNESIIAKLRIKRGMTQAQLADAIGVKTPQISRWETGGRKPKLDALKRIAGALGVDLMMLIEEVNNEKNSAGKPEDDQTHT